MINGGIIGPRNPIRQTDTYGMYDLQDRLPADVAANWPVTIQYLGSTVSNSSAFAFSTLGFAPLPGDLAIFCQLGSRNDGAVNTGTPENSTFGWIATNFLNSSINDGGLRSRLQLSYWICTGNEDIGGNWNGINGQTDLKELHLFRASRPIYDVEWISDEQRASTATGGASISLSVSNVSVTAATSRYPTLSVLSNTAVGGNPGTPGDSFLMNTDLSDPGTDRGEFFHINTSGVTNLRSWMYWGLWTKNTDAQHRMGTTWGPNGLKRFIATALRLKV